MGILRPAGFVSHDELPPAVVAAAFRGDMSAAADTMGPGAVITPMFQPMILDMVKRQGAIWNRINPEPATGHPSRYFEQTRIVVGSFQDPRALSFNPGPDPTRRERMVWIKANYGAIQFTMFDVETNRQQGQFTQLVAKDVQDTVDGALKTAGLAVWNGTDTSMIVPTSLEYCGLLNQINRTASIASSARIVDGLKAEVASLMAQTQFSVRPTAIYVNPVLGDLIDAEERLNQRQIPTTTVNEVTGGLVVNALATQAGTLPLIPDAFLLNGPSGGSTLESGKTDYKAVILTESLLERHYITSPDPRCFQLGLQGGLATQYAVVLFDAIVAKGSANASQNQSITETGMVSYAHSVVTVVR